MASATALLAAQTHQRQIGSILPPTACIPACAAAAAGTDGDVAEFGARGGGPAQELAVDNAPGAESTTSSDEDKVP